MQVPSVGQAAALTLRRLQTDSQLVQSFLRRRSGSSSQRIGAAGGLREGNDLANVGFACKQRDEALDPERKPAMRRGAHAQCSQEPAELGVRLLLGPSHRLEDALLNLLPVDPDRAGSELPAVPGQVVGMAERGGRVALDQVLVSLERARERMVDERPAPGVLVDLEERKVDDPEQLVPRVI